MAKDFTHTSPFGVIEGRDAYLNLVKKNPEAFFRPTIEILDVLGCGDKFAVQYLVNDNLACDCIYIENERISKMFSYYHYGEKPGF